MKRRAALGYSERGDRALPADDRAAPPAAGLDLAESWAEDTDDAEVLTC
ncbi:MAG TPA: hypothetical protein VNF07_01050 [Acidimicrobiales bacterium]|nr:hypothetical protein [Acidimicrobiales bacterium]